MKVAREDCNWNRGNGIVRNGISADPSCGHNAVELTFARSVGFWFGDEGLVIVESPM